MHAALHFSYIPGAPHPPPPPMYYYMCAPDVCLIISQRALNFMYNNQGITETRTHARKHTHANTHARMHARKPHTCTHPRMHTPTHAHVRTHVRTHPERERERLLNAHTHVMTALLTPPPPPPVKGISHNHKKKKKTAVPSTDRTGAPRRCAASSPCVKSGWLKSKVRHGWSQRRGQEGWGGDCYNKQEGLPDSTSKRQAKYKNNQSNKQTKHLLWTFASYGVWHA